MVFSSPTESDLDTLQASEDPQAAARIAARTRERQADQVLIYLRRTPWAYLGYMVIAAVSYRPGLGLVLTVWLAAIALVNTVRWMQARRVERLALAERVKALPKLLGGFWVAGLTVASVVPFVFFQSDDYFSPLVVSCLLIVTMSVAADGVSGSVPAFLGFAAPIILIIAISWFVHDGMRGGVAIGLGMGLAFLLLLSGVRDRMRTLVKMERMIDINARLSQVARAERDRARQASDAKTRFLASASHDLRQPLHTISVLTAALALRPMDPRSSAMISLLEQVVASLTTQLDGLLDISKLDAGVVKAECSTVNLTTLVKMLHEEFRQTAHTKGLVLEFGAIPDEPILVHTDSLLLTRVLRNLLDNAIKFTLRGRASLSLGSLPGEAKAWLRVDDSGIGMTPEQQATVFQEFYQVDNPERDRSRGLGLGLSIVQRLVDLLGVHLQMESRPGQGTSVTLHLPLVKADQPLTSDASSATQLLPQRIDATVLVVDDEMDVRAGLRFLLEELGCQCLEAAGTQEAVQAVAQRRPDVMLADFRLRGDDSGIAAIAAVRQRWGAVHAVLVSGDTAPSRLQEAAAAGVPLLHKPLGLAVLRAELQRAVQQPNSRIGSAERPAVDRADAVRREGGLPRTVPSRSYPPCPEPPS